MIGKPSCDVLGRDDFELFEHASAKLMTERDHYILNVVKISSYDSVANADGRWILFHSCKIANGGNEGKLLGLIGLSVDITATRDRTKIALINEAKHAFCGNPSAFWSAIKDYLASKTNCQHPAIRTAATLPCFTGTPSIVQQ